MQPGTQQGSQLQQARLWQLGMLWQIMQDWSRLCTKATDLFPACHKAQLRRQTVVDAVFGQQAQQRCRACANLVPVRQMLSAVQTSATPTLLQHPSPSTLVRDVIPRLQRHPLLRVLLSALSSPANCPYCQHCQVLQTVLQSHSYSSMHLTSKRVALVSFAALP